MVYVPGRILAIKLPSAAERTCLSTLDVPALKIATVASAMGLPPSSRTTPFITPRLPPRSATGVPGALAEATDAKAIAKANSVKIIFDRLKPIKSNASERNQVSKNSSETEDNVEQE